MRERESDNISRRIQPDRTGPERAIVRNQGTPYLGCYQCLIRRKIDDYTLVIVRDNASFNYATSTQISPPKLDLRTDIT